MREATEAEISKVLTNYDASDPSKVDRARAALRKQVRIAATLAVVFFLAFSFADLVWLGAAPVPPIIVIPLLAFLGIWFLFGLKSIVEARFQAPLDAYDLLRQMASAGPVVRFDLSADGVRRLIRQGQKRQGVRVLEDAGAVVRFHSREGPFRIFLEQLGEKETYVLVDPPRRAAEMRSLLEEE